MIKFFSAAEEIQIIAAIKNAEKNTSGEIRVHLEDDCEGEIMDAAIETFARLKMHETAARNGVLIFLAPERKSFAVIGDEGINEVVGDDFWKEERELMLGHFKKGAFATGIAEAIIQVGKKLKFYFPYQTDDVNELPDDISYG